MSTSSAIGATRCPTVPGGLRCEVLFRHATHTQVVMPLDVTAVVVVAPAGMPTCSAGRRGPDPGLRHPQLCRPSSSTGGPGTGGRIR